MNFDKHPTDEEKELLRKKKIKDLKDEKNR